jgi:hypothetical protein
VRPRRGRTLAAAVLLSGCAAGFTGSTKNVTTVAATLNGDVGSTRTEQGTYWFEYGAGAALDRTTPVRPFGFTADERWPVSERLEALAPPHRLPLPAVCQGPLGR